MDDLLNSTLSKDGILNVLLEGEIHVEGRFLWGSNFTLLSMVETATAKLPAVYKPSKGERPLWDFPYGSLAARELAAYLVSEGLGWDLVPPTVFREDGPAGAGSLQLFVDADPEHHYFSFTEQEKQELRQMAAFDILINNADRKGGHVLKDDSGHIWSIDHGVCFHEDTKLRTVIWDFANERIPEIILKDVSRFVECMKTDKVVISEYDKLLTENEFVAMIQRAERMLEEQQYPEPTSRWAYPWLSRVSQHASRRVGRSCREGTPRESRRPRAQPFRRSGSYSLVSADNGGARIARSR